MYQQPVAQNDVASAFTFAQMEQARREISDDVDEFWVGEWTLADTLDWTIEVSGRGSRSSLTGIDKRY